MASIKRILKISLYMLILFLILTLIITTFDFFNIFSYKTVNIIKIIIPIIIFTFGGFKIGKKSLKNGWLEGLKLGSFISIILLLITLILSKFKWSYLIYLLVLTVSSIFGSMLGINKKKEY